MPEPDTEDLQTGEMEKVRNWRLEQLRRIGYNRDQRQHLLQEIEAGDLQLADVRRLADRGWSVEQAWWALS
jgi:hypothetical protein